MMKSLLQKIGIGKDTEKEKNNSLTYNIQTSGNEDIEEISINFFEKRSIAATKGDIKLPDFEEFLEAFNSVILNNKSKQGFSKGEALKKVGEKMKNDILFMMSNLLIYPTQLISILKRQKDKSYYIFNDIILEESLDKTLKMIEIIQEYLDKKDKYKEITSKPVMTIFMNLYIQGVVLGLAMILTLPYMVVDKEMVSQAALLAKRPLWELDLVSMVIGIGYPSFIVKVIFFLQMVLYFGGLAGIIIYFFKSAFNYLSEKRKREADKIIDELAYISYVRIQIEKLFLGVIKNEDGTEKNHYANVRYIDFLIETNNDAFNRGLVSYEFNKELSRVLTLFLATKNKVLNRNGSEFFYNQLDLILTGYQSWINGSNYNFNLDFIKNKFGDAYKTLVKIFNNEHKKTVAMIGTVMMLLTLTSVGLASLYQFVQSDNLGKAMKYDVSRMK